MTADPFTDLPDRRRVVALAVSIGVHCVALVVLAAQPRVHRLASGTPRLIFVNVQPPREAGTGNDDRALVGPPAPVPLPPKVAAPAPPVAAPPVVKKAPRPRPVHPPAPERAIPARKPSDAPLAEAPSTSAAAEAAGADASASGGAADTADTPAGMGGTAAAGSGGVASGGRAVSWRDIATPPAIVERPPPPYPHRARAMGVEGRVVLEIVVDARGSVEDDVRVLHSVPLLDTSAVTTVRRWRFRPGRDASGRAVRVLMEVPIRFALQEEG